MLTTHSLHPPFPVEIASCVAVAVYIRTCCIFSFKIQRNTGSRCTTIRCSDFLGETWRCNIHKNCHNKIENMSKYKLISVKTTRERSNVRRMLERAQYLFWGLHTTNSLYRPWSFNSENYNDPFTKCDCFRDLKWWYMLIVDVDSFRSCGAI